MGEQLQDRKDLPATGNDLIQLADRIDSNFSQVRTLFNRVEYQFINIENRFISIDAKFIEIDKRFNILESKIDKCPEESPVKYLPQWLRLLESSRQLLP